jgi:hypothetical protein
LDLEAVSAGHVLDDLELPCTVQLAPVGYILPAVGGVSPDVLEPRHAWGEPSQELARTGGGRIRRQGSPTWRRAARR